MDWPKRETAKGSVAAGYRDVWHGSEWRVFLKHPDLLDGPEKGKRPRQESANLGAYAEKHSEVNAHGRSARWLEWPEVREKYPYVLNTLAETNFNQSRENILNVGLEERPALYEFAICHKDCPDKRFKVYIGKTDNLHRRQGEYLTYDEVGRMWPFFEFALRNRCKVMRRYAYIGSDKNTSKLKVSKSLREEMKRTQDLAVYQLETRFLSFFDYAFNGRESVDTKSSDGTNPPKRQLKVVTSQCCFMTFPKVQSPGIFDPDEWYHPPKSRHAHTLHTTAKDKRHI